MRPREGPAVLNEHALLDVVAMRAVERSDATRTVWTEDDRAWASMAAATAVGEAAPVESFLSTRASLVLARLRERLPAFARGVAALRWRPAIAFAVVAASFIIGGIVDEIGAAHRINLLALPLFGVLVWNIAVYALLVAHRLHAGVSAEGPIRSMVARVAAASARPARDQWKPLLATVADEWLRCASPLHRLRIARLLHFGAAAFALGLVAALYLRGLAFEYRATWESTFLDAGAVHAIIAFVLSPGVLLTHLAIPSPADIAAIRAPASENAGRWLHLMAATLVAVVVVPRLALGLVAGYGERRLLRQLRMPLDDPYFARLLRDFRGRPARVVVAPYSYSMQTAATAGLQRLLRRVLGARADVTILPSIPYGGEDRDLARPTCDQADVLVALFSGAATPEGEAHGAFLDRLAACRAGRDPPIALVDEGALAARWPDEPARWSARRASWRTLCAERGIACAFVVLTASDADAAAGELERAMAGAPR